MLLKLLGDIMGRRENKVEKYLDDEVKAHGGLTRKWVSPGNAGVPDRIVILWGRVHFVEVKTLDGVVSENQEREMNRLSAVGASVWTVYGKDGVDKLVDALTGPQYTVKNEACHTVEKWVYDYGNGESEVVTKRTSKSKGKVS